MTFRVKRVLIVAGSVVMMVQAVSSAGAQRKINLTLESAVEIMMRNSYRIRRLEMDIERRRFLLQAEKAGLKSKVYMFLETPNLNRTSDYKWNSLLQRNEIVRENSNRWQMDLAIRQPVILFGYPTNGNVSINYKIYRYGQSEDGESYINYYNRLYLRFEQPLFQPNELKNDLERAELDLEEAELEYIQDQVEIIEDVSDDYYDLFRLAYRLKIYNSKLKQLEQIDRILAGLETADSTTGFSRKQVELELANTQDAIIKTQSELRVRKARMVQRLRLNETDELLIQPEITITPISVDEQEAIQFGYTLRPSMRLLEIQKRQEEIGLEYTKARDAFRLNLEMTYGLERDDERYQALLTDFDNSNSITLNAYVPIWDWGRRKARIQAGILALKQTELRIEERRREIKSTISNAIQNLNECQTRVLNMEQGVKVAADIARQTIEQFRQDDISIQDVLQIIARQGETEENFLEAYLDYRKAVLDLMVNTYYDYENRISLLDKLKARF